MVSCLSFVVDNWDTVAFLITTVIAWFLPPPKRVKK